MSTSRDVMIDDNFPLDGIEHDVDDIRRGSRQRTLTEKGLHYMLE